MIHICTWTPTPGWGAQIGELSIALEELPRGLVINRINVFRTPDGAICFGPPMVPIGKYTGRVSGFDFPDPADRQRFYDALFAALTAAHPELLKKED